MDTTVSIKSTKWYPFSKKEFQSPGSKITRWDLGIAMLDSEVYLERHLKNG